MGNFWAQNPSDYEAPPESISDAYGNVDLGDLPRQIIESQRRKSAQDSMAETMRAIEIANRNRMAAGLPVDGQMGSSIFRNADVSNKIKNRFSGQGTTMGYPLADILHPESMNPNIGLSSDEEGTYYTAKNEPSQSGDFLTELTGGAQSSSTLPNVQRQSKIMPMAASFQQEELPPGQTAEASSKDALSQLIEQQQKRLAGDPERDRRMMWMNFFSNMTGNHANLSDALAAGASSIPKTLETQQAQHDKIVDSSLASQIEIEKFKREQAIKQEMADSQRDLYAAHADAYGRQGVAGATKPMTAAALKLQEENLDSLGIASSINADLGAIDNQIETGELDLGPVSNMINKGRNYIGASTPESRNLQSFQNTLEKLRNDSLRLNKGTQTEGDASRAWNELVANINDPKAVSQRLKEIQSYNARAAEMKKANVDLIRENFGQPPIDTEKYSKQAPAVGKSGASTGGVKFLGFEE